jgi:hypothetical protein
MAQVSSKLYFILLVLFAGFPEMRLKSRNDFTIMIICTLPLEANAVKALFDELYN